MLKKEETWKCMFNTNSDLSPNFTEETTVNCLFNDIWCYLVISCFNLKIGDFQQTHVSGVLYP